MKQEQDKMKTQSVERTEEGKWWEARPCARDGMMTTPQSE